MRSENIEFTLTSKPIPPHLHEFFKSTQLPCKVVLKFRAGGRNDFFALLTSSLSAEAWLRPAAVEQKQIKVEGYGILGLRQALKEDTKDRHETMSSGFRDLKSLVDKSNELKNLAGKLKQMDDSQDPELKEIKASMMSMGFTSGVTKESAGKNYLPQLAREVSDFIKSHLEASGGLLPMIDVFCIYNRARGGNVVSAKDLNDACELLESLALPVRVKSLTSGAKALTLGSQAMEDLMIKVVRKVVENGCCSAKAVAEIFGINHVIALECLSLAEMQGLVCRDEGLQGLHFYENWFRGVRV